MKLLLFTILRHVADYTSLIHFASDNVATYLLLCLTDTILSFTKPSFSVNENNGPAQPVLFLSQPVDCCSTISVWVNIEEDTAKGSYINVMRLLFRYDLGIHIYTLYAYITT